MKTAVVPGREFPVRFRVTLGEHRSGAEYLTVLSEQGIRVSIDAEYILRNSSFVCASKQKTIDLVVVSPKHFGFTKRATLNEICGVAEKYYHLFPCPPETGPALRLLYLDQPIGSYLDIAMRPINGRYGDKKLFYLVTGGDAFWLGDSLACPLNEWSPDREIVFRPRKLSAESRNV